MCDFESEIYLETTEIQANTGFFYNRYRQLGIYHKNVFGGLHINNIITIVRRYFNN